MIKVYLQFDIWNNISKVFYDGETYEMQYIEDVLIEYENSFGDYWLKGDSIIYCPYVNFVVPDDVSVYGYFVYSSKLNKYILCDTYSTIMGGCDNHVIDVDSYISSVNLDYASMYATWGVPINYLGEVNKIAKFYDIDFGFGKVKCIEESYDVKTNNKI